MQVLLPKAVLPADDNESINCIYSKSPLRIQEDSGPLKMSENVIWPLPQPSTFNITPMAMHRKKYIIWGPLGVNNFPNLGHR